MAEEVIRRRRVLNEPDTDVTYDTVTDDDDASTGLGVALAVALAIIAVLALFALARGVFTPTQSQAPTSIQIEPGTPVQ